MFAPWIEKLKFIRSLIKTFSDRAHGSVAVGIHNIGLEFENSLSG